MFDQSTDYPSLVIINGKMFRITVDDGEVFYKHVHGAIDKNMLMAIIGKLNLTNRVKVFDAKNGVFSAYSRAD